MSQRIKSLFEKIKDDAKQENKRIDDKNAWQQAVNEGYTEFVARLKAGNSWDGEIDYRDRKVECGFDIHLKSANGYILKRYKFESESDNFADLPSREITLTTATRALETKGCYIGGMRHLDAKSQLAEAVLSMRNLGFDLDDWFFLLDPVTHKQSPWIDARFHLKICLEALRSLQIFHKAGFLHCDIKADNICLRPNFEKASDNGENITCTIESTWIIDLGNALWNKFPPGPSVFNSDVPDRYIRARDQKLPLDNLRGLDWRIDLWRLGNLVENMLKRVDASGSNLKREPAGVEGAAYREALDYLLALPAKLRSFEDEFAKKQNFISRLANRWRSLIGTRDFQPKYVPVIHEIELLIKDYAWPTIEIPKARPADAQWNSSLGDAGPTKEVTTKTIYLIIRRIARFLKKAFVFTVGSALLLFFIAVIFISNDKPDKPESTTPPQATPAPPSLADTLKQLPAKGTFQSSHYAELSSAFTRLDQAELEAQKPVVDNAIKLIVRHSTPTETTQERLQALLPGLRKLSELGHEDAAHLLGYYAACRLKPAQPELARQGLMQRLHWEEKKGQQEAANNTRTQLAALETNDPQLCLQLDQDYKTARQQLK